MAAQFKRKTSFSDTKPQLGGKQDGYKISDHYEMYEWPSKGKSGQVRWTGPVIGVGTHKVKVKKKDGSFTEISKTCLAYNSETDERDSTKKCPYCACKADDVVKFSKAYYGNVIDRRLQEDKPRKITKPTAAELKSGFKAIDSDSWTPARLCRVPSGGSLRLTQLGQKNIVKSKTGVKKAFDVTHPRYGFDIDQSFDKTLPAANMYSFDRNTDAKFTPVTEEEAEYLLWDVEKVCPPEDYATAKKELEGIIKRLGLDEDDDAEDDDDDEPRSKKSSGKKRAAAEDDGDDDSDGDDDEDEDLELDTKKKPGKKRAAAEDDDDAEDGDDSDEDEEGFDDDEDEPPKSKKSTKKKPVEDEDEEEEDEDADEDEDDEPPARKKSAGKKKPVDEDDDDLDDIDEEEEDEDADEDEDDEPPARKKSSSKAPAKKTRR